MHVEIVFDPVHTEIVPDDALTPEGGQDWAARVAQRWRERGIPGADADAATRILEVTAFLSEGAVNVLVLDPDTGVFAPLILTATAEQVEPSTIVRNLGTSQPALPPVAEAVGSEHLGVGITTAVLQQDGTASRRWAYIGADAVLMAALGPTVPTVLGLLEGAAHGIVRRVRVEGFTPRSGDGVVPDLLEVFRAPAETW